MGFDKLKLNKQLVRSANEAGYTEPREIQLKTLTRIIGGQDLIAIGHEGCGKTTAYILATLNRFNYAPDGVPKVLILVPDKEQVEAVLAQFELLNRNSAISIVGLYVTPGTEAQMNALADGADIVVATPDRARAIYLKLGLNLNKMELFIVDDADQHIKRGMQLPLTELANSIGKCQHLVFTDVMHSRIEKMIAPFMKLPAVVEVEALDEKPLVTHPQVLYQLPNFATKINLLNLFVQDEELFTKTAVIINSRANAEKVFQTMDRRLDDSVAYLNSWQYDKKGFATVEEFKASNTRVLVIADENNNEADLTGIPFLINFDLPAEKEAFISRITNHHPDSEEETMVITFATDMELSTIKKIEQAIGKKIPVAALPDDLVIVNDNVAKKAPKEEVVDPTQGGAFHEKKASNAKTYNFSSSKKAKMNKKKNH
ncbi:MAG: DEAD/DEAH box helicase [Mucilaginibacter sp.]